MKINNILEILKLENLDPFEPCNGEALEINFKTEYQVTLDGHNFSVYGAFYGNGEITFLAHSGTISFWPATVKASKSDKTLELFSIELE